MSFTLNKVNKEATGLTQQFHLTGDSTTKVLPSQGQFKPAVFSRTRQASRTGEILVPIGTGQVDPVNHARIIHQLSRDSHYTTEELIDMYKKSIFRLAHESSLVRTVVVSIMGTADRSQRLNNLPKVPASMIIQTLGNAMKVNMGIYEEEIMLYIVADSLVAMLAQVGLVAEDAPHVYRVKPSSLFPSYKDLIEIQSLRDVTFLATNLANADISLIRKSIESSAGKAISPSLLLQHLQNSFAGAYDSSKGSYAAKDIVDSVLGTLQRIWSPMTTETRMPKERVLKSPFIADLQADLSMFMAAQDMVITNNGLVEVSYGDEELTAVILPLFVETMSLVAPHKVRPMSDAVDFFGMQASRDHNGEPGHIFFYEDWRVSDYVPAFVPIRQTINSSGRFLYEMGNVGSALSNAIGPVQKVVALKDAIGIRVDSYNMEDETKRAKNPTEMHLAFPSIEVREAQLEVAEVGSIEKFVIRGEQLVEAEAKRLKVTVDDIKDLQFDYYSSIMHLAVHRGANVSIGELAPDNSKETGDDSFPIMRPLYLKWDVRTTFTRQRGLSALLNGEVMTTEPLEVLAYAQDFEPTSVLDVKKTVLADYENAIHMWPWHKYSTQLSLNASFDITLRNKRLNVSVNEHEMLALGARREELRFMNQYDTIAVVNLWIKELIEDYNFVEQKAKSSRDPFVQEAYKGRAIQTALRLVSRLSAIANNGVGQRAIAQVKQRVADALYGATNSLDGYDAIHVGAQNHRLRVWAGIRTLELLQLISDKDAMRLAQIVSSSDALSYALSAVDLSSFN